MCNRNIISCYTPQRKGVGTKVLVIGMNGLGRWISGFTGQSAYVKDENNKTVEGFVEADDNNVATGKYTDYEHAKRLITVK